MSNFSTNYAPQYTPPEERDFFSYYNDLKYEKFMQDWDNFLKKTKIMNFDLLHNQCIDDKLDKSQQYYQTVFEENLARYKKQDKQKFAGSALRNQKEVDIFVERKIVSEHFTNHVKIGSCNSFAEVVKRVKNTQGIFDRQIELCEFFYCNE